MKLEEVKPNASVSVKLPAPAKFPARVALPEPLRVVPHNVRVNVGFVTVNPPKVNVAPGAALPVTVHVEVAALNEPVTTNCAGVLAPVANKPGSESVPVSV